MDQDWMRKASFSLAGVAALSALYLAATGAVTDALTLFGLVVAALAMLLWQDRLPALFTLLFTAVAVLNGAGYAFELWKQPVWFDELVHVVTPFVLIAALAWLLVRRNDADPSANRLGYFAKVCLLGVLIGLAWEGFEYIAGIIGSPSDSLIDLAMDALGSLLAAVFCLWTARSRPALSN